MLYLAEVQKQKGGFGLGGGKTELKLLASQRGEQQSWFAVTGEEVIPAEEATNFSPGALVLVDLGPGKQVQRVYQDTARQMVNILQSFSRQQDKFKTQEEEIEQWKQSLTYQSQELNRREMELQAREEQLEQMEEEFERLEAQRQEIEGSREEANRLREELERNRQELEGSWENLRAEMLRLEELQEQVQQGSGQMLDEQQASYIKELLDRLCAQAPTSPALEMLNRAFERVGEQQSVLNHHCQQLEQKRAEAERVQQEADRQAKEQHHRTQEWEQAQSSLEQARSELKVQQSSLKLKQEYAETLALNLQGFEELHQQVYRLAETSDKVSISQKVDVEALERMPLDELQDLVGKLQQDLEKVRRFVGDQEEELGMQRQTLDEVQAKLQRASDYDRRQVEAQLAEEQDRYQMLNETLVGQRRNLRDREDILSQHQAVLWRRLGKPPGSGQDGQLDFGSVLAQMEGQRQQMAEELQKLERQIEQMRLSIKQAEEIIARQAAELAARKRDLDQLEKQLLEQQTAAAELWGKVNLYQEMLQPVQDQLNDLRQKLEAVQGGLYEVQQTDEYQQQVLAQLRGLFSSLMGEPVQQLAVS
ncbi:pilus motility taxis protein HmpF [Kamptonema formosum]|uniref:pilus motility taxis protein HmpF n=1 Tax=Kamptonema formosum TaxID=331992 RepID=UPI00034C8B45|nr:pilus motility taxis protein HmpF [Oscillatoria sp. PCC 10802]